MKLIQPSLALLSGLLLSSAQAATLYVSNEKDDTISVIDIPIQF